MFDPSEIRLAGGRGPAYTRNAMPTSSLKELGEQISAGEYAVDSDKLAGEMLSKFALIRRVRRLLARSEQRAGNQNRRSREAQKGPYFRAPSFVI